MLNCKDLKAKIKLQEFRKKFNCNNLKKQNLKTFQQIWHELLVFNDLYDDFAHNSMSPYYFLQYLLFLNIVMANTSIDIFKHNFKLRLKSAKADHRIWKVKGNKTLDIF